MTCIVLSTINSIHTDIKAGVPSGNPLDVHDQFFNCTTYKANLYLSMTKWVAKIMKTPIGEVSHKKGAE